MSVVTFALLAIALIMISGVALVAFVAGDDRRRADDRDETTNSRHDRPGLDR